MRGYLGIGLLLVGVALLAGCSGLKPTRTELAEIQQIQLNIKDGDVTYYGKLPPEYGIQQGNGWLSFPLTAPIGLIIELWKQPEIAKKKAQRMRNLLEDAKLDMPDMFSHEFKQSLDATGLFSQVFAGNSPKNSEEGENSEKISLVPAGFEVAAKSSARMELVVHYGLQGSHFFADSWSPWLEVEAKLFDGQQKLLWKTTTEIGFGDGRVGELEFPDPFRSSAMLRRQFRHAAQAAAKELIEHLTTGE